MPTEPRGQRPRAGASADVVTELDSTEAPAGTGHGPILYLMVRRMHGCDLLPVHEGQEVLVGRSPDATVVVDETRVSRQHTRIHHREGQIVVEDLGSRNGTRINDDKVLRAAVRRVFAGDILRIGSVELIVVAAPKPAPSPTETVVLHGDDVIAADAGMVHVFKTARRLGSVLTTVLLLGETGVGKEVVAEQIHRGSNRSKGPFVRLNCAALPESLLESELFGYEKGAFTGAGQRREGFLEAAHGGTLLLDEIGDLPLSMQAKLLRVLEDRRVTRLGGRDEVEIDVRFICATNADLAQSVAAGRFRQDLFFRVSAFTLKIPPLRERPLEIELLADLFALRFAACAGLPKPHIEADTLAAMRGYAWPGNVRELRNAIEHAMVNAAGQNLRAEHLPESMLTARVVPGPPLVGAAAMRDQLVALERRSIEEALGAHGGNQSRAAEQLGISRRALVYKLTKYGIGR